MQQCASRLVAVFVGITTRAAALSTAAEYCSLTFSHADSGSGARRAALKDVRVHDQRHTFASTAVDAGSSTS